ncbi:GTPase HflX [Elusimicrobiota bacterium]
MEKVILVGLMPKYGRSNALNSIDELERLAVSANAQIVDKVIQKKERIDPAFLIGAGKARELAKSALINHVHTIIFDEELSPTQQRNLEEVTGVKVIDRARLILDVFAKRARTKEGILQVELAQNTHLLPRLTKRGAQFSQQFGGIGTKGPGERELEYDRRRIRTKIVHLNKRIEKVKKERDIQRKQRIAKEIPQVALIGYTNVGKSSLLNALIASKINSRSTLHDQGPVYVDDRYFATLDPTTRRVNFSTRGVWALVTDTVGFIQKLPTALIASFRATLEEIKWASVLLYIGDATRSISAIENEEKEVSRILNELKITNISTLRVFSKIDMLTTHELTRLRKQYPERILISSKTGEGLPEMLKALEEMITNKWPKQIIHMDAKKGAILSELYSLGKVLTFEETRPGTYKIVMQAPPERIIRLKMLGKSKE